MAEIRPFRGLLYSKNAIGGDFSAVMAPPYDVIAPLMQDELHAKSQHNIIRLILGKVNKDDSERENFYTRSKNTLEKWIKEGVLVRDKEEAFYVYLQEYMHDGKKCRRIGFIGLMKIGEPGDDEVLPHEHTLKKPKEDRMNLIKEVKANLSPIFSLYDGRGSQIVETLENCMASSAPIIDAIIDDERNALWRLSDKAAKDIIISEMKGRKAFIADGHHRYEVAKNYRDMLRREKGYDGRADHVMMYFAAIAPKNDLTIMATHRVMKDISPESVDKIAAKMGEYFEVRECGKLSELMKSLDANASKPGVFGVMDGKKYLSMVPKDKKRIVGLIAGSKTEEWKQLDVSLLHSAVLEKLLLISNVEGNITYVRESEKAESLVKDGSHKIAFLLNPTRIEQLKAVAESGEMMPQKSTYFYPKLLTGLVINKFGE